MRQSPRPRRLVRFMDVYWMEQTLADLPASDDWLNEHEAIRLTSMRIPKRRNDWRLGRWTGKQVVARYLGLADERHSLREIEIRSAPSGAPEVFIDYQRARVSISLSHRGGTAMCAIAESSVALGCDLEIVERHSPAFITDYFTAREQSIITEADERDLFSSLLWSAKESALKAFATGLRVDTRCVEVQFERPPFGCGTWGWLEIRHISGQTFKGWWQRRAGLVRTLAGDPAPSEPIALQSPNRLDTGMAATSAALLVS